MKALLLVDVQNDFLPGGALAVPDGDRIIPVINRLMPSFDLVVASQDWHPADHSSFASRHPEQEMGEVIELDGIDQILWPDHAVQGTPGAELAQGLNVDDIDHVMRKGTDREIDSYSAFFDNGHRKATGLDEFLKSREVTCVHIAGLATDYCVKYTALDAHELGFDVRLILDAVRGVEREPGDCDRAFREMEHAGVVMVNSEDLA